MDIENERIEPCSFVKLLGIKIDGWININNHKNNIYESAAN